MAHAVRMDKTRTPRQAAIDEFLGGRVALLREKAGFVQSALGGAIGQSQQTVGNIESGKTHMTPGVLRKIAQALEVSVDQIFAGLEYHLMRVAHGDAVVDSEMRAFDSRIPRTRQRSDLRSLQRRLHSVGLAGNVPELQDHPQFLALLEALPVYEKSDGMCAASQARCLAEISNRDFPPAR